MANHNGQMVELTKSSRVKTVEGRARPKIIQTSGIKDAAINGAQGAAARVRGVAGSRLSTGGREGSVLATEVGGH